MDECSNYGFCPSDFNMYCFAYVIASILFSVVLLVEALRYKLPKVAGSIPDGAIGIFH